MQRKRLFKHVYMNVLYSLPVIHHCLMCSGRSVSVPQTYNVIVRIISALHVAPLHLNKKEILNSQPFITAHPTNNEGKQRVWTHKLDSSVFISPLSANSCRAFVFSSSFGFCQLSVARAVQVGGTRPPFCPAWLTDWPARSPSGWLMALCAEWRKNDSSWLSGLLDNHSIWGVGQAVLSAAHHSSFGPFSHPFCAPSLHPFICPTGLGDDPPPLHPAGGAVMADLCVFTCLPCPTPVLLPATATRLAFDLIPA